MNEPFDLDYMTLKNNKSYLQRELREMRVECGRLRTALEFYANSDSWDNGVCFLRLPEVQATCDASNPATVLDNGFTARRALGGES